MAAPAFRTGYGDARAHEQHADHGAQQHQQSAAAPGLEGQACFLRHDQRGDGHGSWRKGIAARKLATNSLPISAEFIVSTSTSAKSHRIAIADV
jgi:hypothetical protein